MYYNTEPTPEYFAWKQAMQEMQMESAQRENEEREQQLKYDKERQMQYESSLNIKQNNAYDSYNEFCSDVRTSLVETALNILFEKCIGTTSMKLISEDTRHFNKSLVADYVKNEGAFNIIDEFKGKSHLLSELAYSIETAYNTIMESVDPDDASTYVTSEEEEHFFENISGDEDIEDLCDIIRNRVAADTKDFFEDNRIAKSEILASMQDTEERINNVQLGDEELDAQAKYEFAVMGEDEQNEIKNRSCGILEMVMKQMTASIIANEQLRNQYVNESGQLNNDNIFEKAQSQYTFMQMLEGFRMKKIDEAFLEKEFNI